MAHLFDTNIFLRLAEKNSPQRSVVLEAIRKLRADNQIISFTPQVSILRTLLNFRAFENIKPDRINSLDFYGTMLQAIKNQYCEQKSGG